MVVIVDNVFRPRTGTFFTCSVATTTTNTNTNTYNRGNIRTSLRRVPSSVVIGTNDCGIVRDNKGNKIKKSNTNQNNAIKDEIHIHDNNTAMVFADIQERLDKAGLGEKVQLFLLPEKPIGRPVILALPKALSPDESKLKKSWIRKIVKVLCYPLAALSTFIYSFSMHVLNPNFFNSLVYRRDLTVLYSCIPLILGVVAVQTIHEAAHYLVARRRNIKIGRPVPIPSLHIASFPFFWMHHSSQVVSTGSSSKSRFCFVWSNGIHHFISRVCLRWHFLNKQSIGFGHRSISRYFRCQYEI